MLTLFSSSSDCRLRQQDTITKIMTLTSTILVIALVALIGADLTVAACPPNPLNRPTEWLHQEWSQHQSTMGHESGYMTPSDRNFLMAMNLLNATGKEIVPKHEDQSCPTLPSSEPDLEGRSLCPWHYIINVDEDRYPSHLTEARCLVDCVDNALVSSERINYNVLVLRKNTAVCDGNYYTYDLGYQPVGVGCTCAAPAAV